MELLIPALVELLTLFIPLVAGLVSGLTLLITIVVDVVALGCEIVLTGSIAAALAARKAARAKADKGNQASASETKGRLARILTSPRVARWTKRLSVVCAGLLGVSLIVVLLVNFFFFESAVRLALSGVRTTTGVETTFEHASGNLLAGSISLTGLKVLREDHALSDVDLTIESLDVDVVVTSLLSREVKFSHVKVGRVQGQWTRHHEPEKPDAPQGRRLLIRSLLIDDVAIAIRDDSRGEPIALSLEIENWESRDLRSRWAALDVLFRTNATGTIEQRPFRVESSGSFDEGAADWEFEEVPAYLAGKYLGEPLSWLTDGRVSVDAESSWKLSDSSEIHMDWKLLASNLKAEAPDDLPILKHGVVAPVIAYLNNNPAELPIAFSVDLDPQGFEEQVSPFTKGLSSAVADGVTKELAKASAVPEERVIEEAKEFGEKIRGFFKPEK